MATLISYATGNLTGASTWKTTETASGALTMLRNNTTTLGSNTTVTSPAFTITNAKVIEGVMLFVMANQATPAGTLTVNILKSGVSQTSVVVNCADLPHSATGTNDVLAVVPCFFKFTGTATGDGTANWTINMVTSNVSGAQITYSRNSGTTGDFTKALRTSTTASAAAGDDLYVLGELSGAGTHNAFTVTMDSTANTVYGNGSVNTTAVNGGGMKVACYGTLTWGISASTAYILGLKGDAEIMWNGTWNQGVTGGSEVPRGSTADLQMTMNSASGDFGVIVRNMGTFSAAGLSPTSGKNIVKCKLTSDVTGSNTETSGSTTNSSTANQTYNSGVSFSAIATAMTDNSTNGIHNVWIQDGSSRAGATTQTVAVWVAQGTGTHNRYVSLRLTDASGGGTNYCQIDVDMQAGTIGSHSTAGTGTYASSTITSYLGGYWITLTGTAKSTSTTPFAVLMSATALATVSYAGDTTQCFLFARFTMVLGSNPGDITYNVDTDTGWKSGNVVAVSTTTQTPGDCELVALDADAGASSFTSPVYPFDSAFTGNTTSAAATHSGTAPFQADIALISRNVKIRSLSTSLYTYFYAEPLASVTCSWTEFCYLGQNTALKFGITIADGAVATAKSFTYCSMHDCYRGLQAITISGTASINLTASNNVIWNPTTYGVVVAGSTPIDWTFDSNVIMKCPNHGANFISFVGTFSNNIVVACSQYGISYTSGGDGSIQNIGNFNGNTVHSCTQPGMILTVNSATYCSGTIDSFTSWRNAQYGLQLQGTTSQELIFTNLTLYGNYNTTTGHAQLSNSINFLTIINGTISGDTTFNSHSGIFHAQNIGDQVVNLHNVDFSGTGTGKQACSGHDIYLLNASWVPIAGVLNHCKFGAPTAFSKANWGKYSYLRIQRYNQTAGDERIESTYGQIKTDTSIFNTASPSMRLTPTSASVKLTSATPFPYGGLLGGRGLLVPVASGAAINVSVFVRKSAAGDGTAYTGNQPRLIQKANPALGQNSDVVLATYSAGTGAWNQLTATSSTATDDGAWEFIIDCDGTGGGWINVDDWQTSGGILNDGTKYWYQGGPVWTPNPPIAQQKIYQRGTPY